MNIRQEKINDVILCMVNGEIHMNNSPELRKFFDTILKQNAKKVIVDFFSISYIDSAGLATLIEMLQRLRKVDGKIRLCRMNEKIKNIFEVTRLHQLFEIFETCQEALKDF